ncbi:fish-egg lectin-like [Odontesthes bonariensis]|uniref:fish-egg lectin-like n=1 Tax=Odontesthes bonariensis TaxID=219752 RepID=UPI003F58C6CC
MKAVAVFSLFLSCLSLGHGWSCKEAPQQFPAAQIDAGQGKVVLRDIDSRAYFLSGSQWYRLGSVSLKHVSVGVAGIWGVDSDDTVYKYIAGDFVRTTGQSLSQVDAGGVSQIVGVRHNGIYCLEGSAASAFKQVDTLPWSRLPGELTYFSCSPTNTCWGVNSAGSIFYTTLSPTCKKDPWVHVPGNAKMVEVGYDGSVFVVNSSGQVFQRTGISSDTPQGTTWSNIQMCVSVNHLSYDLGHLWIVSKGGIILQCFH